MIRIFNSQRGFSLIQGMILAAVLAGTSLITTKLLTAQKLAQKGAESRDQVNELHRLAYSILQDKEHCRATLIGIAASLQDPSKTLASNSHPALTNILTSTGDQILKVYAATGDTYMNGNITVSAINVSYPIGQTAAPATLRPGFARLRINYKRFDSDVTRTKNGFGGKDISKTILLRIQRSTTAPNAFESCYAVTDADADSLEDGNNDLNKEMCEDLGIFSWNEANSKCELRDLECSAPGTIYTGISSTGDALCMPLQEWINFGEIFEPSPTPCPVGSPVRLEIIGAGPKVRIRCN